VGAGVRDPIRRRTLSRRISSNHRICLERTAVSDVVFVLLTIGLFVLLGLALRAVERL
jgi:hypothetical protein